MTPITVEIRECVSGSTMHGLPKVAKPTSKSLQILWLLICMVTMVSMATHFSYLLERFLERPLTTSFSVNQSSRELPRIVLCTYTFSMPVLEQLLSSERAVITKSTTNDTKFLDLILKHTADGLFASTNQTASESSGNPVTGNTNTRSGRRSNAGRSRKANARVAPLHFLMGCSINDMDCTDGDNWRIVGDVSKYRCFELDTSVELAHQNPTTLEMYLHVERFSGEEEDDHFSARLHQTLEYDPTVYLHVQPSGSTCLQPSTGIPISPGQMHKLELRSTKFVQKPLRMSDTETEKCTNSPPVEVQHCDKSNRFREHRRHVCTESAQLCFANRLQETLLHHCRELSPYHETSFLVGCPDVPTVASKEHRKGVANESHCVKSVLRNDRLMHQISLSCTPCETRKWKNSVQFSPWPKEEVNPASMRSERSVDVSAFQHRLRDWLAAELGSSEIQVPFKIFTLTNTTSAGQTDRFYRKHIAYVKMEIELDVDVMVEELAYPFISFMSEVGGLMGLWLGCSVITFLEPLELIFRILPLCLQNRKKENLGSKSGPV